MIIRGTTPTIRYTFHEVSVDTITEAYLTIEQDGRNICELELDDATAGDNYLEWTLSQTQTLTLEQMANYDLKRFCDIQCRYAVGSKAYASKVSHIPVEMILKEGEI